MMGAGALAAVTVIGAGLVDYPAAVAEPPRATVVAPAAGAKPLKQEIRYIRLKPGQDAPKGAMVIREAAPTPRVIVRQVVVSGPSRVSPVVARSRQSGR